MPSTFLPEPIVISNFLKAVQVNFATDLTSRYNEEMECQVMADRSMGEPVYDGTKLIPNTFEYDDPDYGPTRFHHIRIPKNSMGKDGDPYYNERQCRFPFDRVVDSIGMTGWNWKQQRSMWVAFDFDSITTHCEGIGLSAAQLNAVKEAAKQIPWVQVRRSTGGSGLHLYVYFTPDNLPESENHNVHAAASRAVLGLMSREVGFDFQPHVDVCGSNIWVWARRITESNQGLSLVKDTTDDFPGLPSNWRDNIEVVTGKRSRIRVKSVRDAHAESFDQITSAVKKVVVDDTHQEMERRIDEMGYSIVWVPDHNCWQTHTKAFKDLMDTFPEDYKGLYETNSLGDDPGEPNCFVFPLEEGAVRITRFSKGIREANSWAQDGSDWTWCYFNRDADLWSAAACLGGAMDEDGKSWQFNNPNSVEQLVSFLGGEFSLADSWKEVFCKEDRNFFVRTNKEGRVILEIEKKKDDKTPPGFMAKRGKFIKALTIFTNSRPGDNDEDISLDHLLRALKGPTEKHMGWVVRDQDGKWIGHTSYNVPKILKAYEIKDCDPVMGKLLLNNWNVVNAPFQPEYIGDRQWNRFGAQLTVQPGDEGPHPHWDLVLSHCGRDLGSALPEDAWARQNGIKTGCEYLQMWVSAMFKHPYDRLPYLFFYGPQNCGKSCFHEALSMLMSKGFVMADEALRNQGNFNGELENAILCAVEETDIGQTRGAYNKLKSWVTGLDVMVHPKNQQPYLQKNMTHWIQTANDKSHCPIFPGDTRITMIYVGMPEQDEIPKAILLEKLMDEAPAFMRTIMDLRIPAAPGRLRIPVIATGSKMEAEEFARNALEDFIADCMLPSQGAAISFAEFYDLFVAWLPVDQRPLWSRKRVSNIIRARNLFPLGKMNANQLFIGNWLPLEQAKSWKATLPLQQRGYGSQAKLTRFKDLDEAFDEEESDE